MATEAELIEQKREERKKLLEEIKRKRAAAAYGEGVIGAAERGEYGDVGQGGEKGEFDDEINQDPGNEDPSRFSMANLKRAILGEKGGLESLMYFLPGTGDVMSAQDSIRAAKAAQEAENIVDKIYLTRIHQSYDGDTFFPKIGPEWKEISRVSYKADEKHAHDYSFLTFEKSK